ncbi:hypothetical protein [Collimonas humicola]|uniref:hypothetical protein n=1 Tax=Collimonas humicola TaxID=2825886 RepID=UPI001B8D25EA|nr:hypothetical protein [Collimonas humicola]
MLSASGGRPSCCFISNCGMNATHEKAQSGKQLIDVANCPLPSAIQCLGFAIEVLFGAEYLGPGSFAEMNYDELSTKPLQAMQGYFPRARRDQIILISKFKLVNDDAPFGFKKIIACPAAHAVLVVLPGSCRRQRCSAPTCKFRQFRAALIQFILAQAISNPRRSPGHRQHLHCRDWSGGCNGRSVSLALCNSISKLLEQ